VRFSQLLSAPFLAALEMQIFVNNPQCTDENVESLLLSQVRLPYNLYCVGGDVKHCTIQSNPMPSQEEPPNSQRNLSIDHQFCGLFTKICISSAARKGALNS